MKGIAVLKNYILVLYKENGDSFIKVISFRDGTYKLDTSYNVEIEDQIKNNIKVHLSLLKMSKTIENCTETNYGTRSAIRT